MGKRKKLMKGIGYAAAPKATFKALNPGKAAMLAVASRTMDRMVPSRRRRSHNRSTLAGLGAAAVAVPVGLWIGRRYWNTEPHTPSVQTAV